MTMWLSFVLEQAEHRKAQIKLKQRKKREAKLREQQRKALEAKRAAEEETKNAQQEMEQKSKQIKRLKAKYVTTCFCLQISVHLIYSSILASVTLDPSTFTITSS